MSKKIKAIVSEKTIVLHYDGAKINVQKDTDQTLFKQIDALIKAGDEKALISKFLDIKAVVESFSDDLIEVQDDGKAYLKGSSVAIPSALIKKMIELERGGGDFLPLMRFWKKLQDNPSKNSREQLYGFVLANNVPLTEQGDLVLEKGVNQKGGGLPGELVDTHSRSVDNSVGMVVEMPREKVEDNPNKTCSTGLHVAAPDYVRNTWKTPVIVEVVVNPVDVVSVPSDYKNTKMRVCRYQVMGYSGKSSRTQQVVKLSDFLKTPDAEMKAVLENGVKNEKKLDTSDDAKGKTDKVQSVPQPKTITKGNEYAKQIEGMSAKQIVQYILDTTGTKIELSLKNKQSIVRKATSILESIDSSKQIAEKAEVEGEEGINQKVTDSLKKVVAPKGGEKGPWMLTLISVTTPSQKLMNVKNIKEHLGFGLKDSKEIVDTLPFIAYSGVSKRFAERQQKQLSKIGFLSDVSKIGASDESNKAKEYSIKGMKKDELRGVLIDKFNETMGSRATLSDLQNKVTELLTKAGYSVK